MPLIDFTLVVQAEQEEVFAFLSDLANIHLWARAKILELIFAASCSSLRCC